MKPPPLHGWIGRRVATATWPEVGGGHCGEDGREPPPWPSKGALAKLVCACVSATWSKASRGGTAAVNTGLLTSFLPCSCSSARSTACRCAAPSSGESSGSLGRLRGAPTCRADAVR
eukprot:scaffold74831_cov67-Phaeocystis_antarctica.AAC.6